MTDKSGGVPSVERALSILDLVAERGSVRFTELLDVLGLPRSSTHGLLQTLVARGWLEHDQLARRYSLGLHVWQIGQRYSGHRELANIAQPVMDALAKEVGETVQLARLEGVENVYIAISEAPRPMRLASTVGLRLHAHATGIGKALLSRLPEAEATRRLSSVVLPRFTEHTVTDVDELLELLREARARGYALDDEEFLTGCRCVAVPLLGGGDDDLIAAMSVTAPSSRCEPDWPLGPLELLRQAATDIRRRLGYG